MKTEPANAHSPIGASSMSRWSKCPGSVALCKSVPSFSSRYAEEGTEAHDWLAKTLTGEVPIRSVPEPFREPVTYAFDVVCSQVAQGGKKAKLLVEHGFDLGHVYPGCHGTADVVIYNPIKRWLIVSDYKHGQGIVVEVEDNSQLQYYGLGALTTLKEIGPIERVVLQVIQPRIDHPDGFCRSWHVDPIDLVDFAIELQQFAKATEAKDAPLVPGEHCRFCSASAICPELKTKAIAIAQNEFDEISEDSPPSRESEQVGGGLQNPNYQSESLTVEPVKPSGLSVDQVAKAMQWAPTLSAWLKSLHEYAYQLASRGEKIPGFKLVEKRAKRNWKNEENLVEFLVENGFSDEEMYEKPKVKSPAQMEKLVGKNERHVFEKFYEKKSSGLTLVVETDSRPEVSTAAEVEFSEITDGT